MKDIVILAIVVVPTALMSWKILSFIKASLQRRATELKAEADLLDRYYDLTARFLRHTNDEEHGDLRQTLVTLPALICDGFLARYFFIRNGNGKKAEPRPRNESELHKQMERLPEGMQEVFGQALGIGLLASTYELTFLGRIVRRTISNWLSEQETSVSDPEQVVIKLQPIRIKAAHKHRPVPA